MENLEQMVAQAQAEFAAAVDASALEQAKARFLGKSGSITAQLKTLGKLDADARREAGARINQAKGHIEQALEARRGAIREARLAAQLAAEALDVTLPGRGLGLGGLHPVSRTLERIENLFRSIGFEVADGPEIETDFHNFTALNTPENHPARSMHDTFYLEGERDVLLRTHTSPVQIRTMLRAAEQGSGPPIYAVCPGRVYRRDTADATHLPVFHQIEGLVIDRGISMADLAGTIEEFTKAYFGESMTSRLRPSYFPFTEPSAEMDISQPDGSWLEIGGCGMVHPNVLRHCGLDPEEWTGFAFGFGIDRLAKIRHDVADLRDFVTNDMRFLEQF